MNMSDLNKTKGCFLALGTFDGLHLGHKKVMTAGENKKRYALLFSQHPQTALTGKAPTALITKRLEKKLLEKWGVTPIYIDFRDVMSQSPEEFFGNIIKNIAPSEISVGFNYRFGKNAEGDVNKLSKLSNENGIKLFAYSQSEYSPLLRHQSYIIPRSHRAYKLHQNKKINNSRRNRKGKRHARQGFLL